MADTCFVLRTTAKLLFQYSSMSQIKTVISMKNITNKRMISPHETEGVSPGLQALEL